MSRRNLNASTIINNLIKKVQDDQTLHDLIAWKLCAVCLKMESYQHNDLNKYYFKLPVSEVLSFSETLEINIKNPFPFWAGGDEYYRSTMILASIGLSISDDSIARNSCHLMLAKTWNNIIDKNFPVIFNTSIMDMIIRDRLTPHHLLKKRNLYDLIGRYYVPTILRKYGRDVVDNPIENASLLITQGYARIYQIFHGTKGSGTDSIVKLYKNIEEEIKKKAA